MITYILYCRETLKHNITAKLKKLQTHRNTRAVDYDVDLKLTSSADSYMEGRWDYVMLLPINRRKQVVTSEPFYWETIVRRLREAGLIVTLYESGRPLEVYYIIII